MMNAGSLLTTNTTKFKHFLCIDLLQKQAATLLLTLMCFYVKCHTPDKLRLLWPGSVFWKLSHYRSIYHESSEECRLRGGRIWAKTEIKVEKITKLCVINPDPLTPILHRIIYLFHSIFIRRMSSI